MKKTSIMVVEDEVLVARDIESRLVRMGYEVVAKAGKGQEAIDKALAIRPDLIMMDIHLRDEIDGVEAAIEIRKQVDIPIIYCTAYSNEETLGRAKISEPYGYVLKPFDNRELEINIEIALYKHRVELELQDTKEKLNATLSNIDEGVLATDANGDVFLINPVAEKLTGYRRERAQGKNLADVLKLKEFEAGGEAPDLVESLMVKHCKINSLRQYLVRPDGIEVPIEVSANLVSEDGDQSSGIVVTFRDISKQLGYEYTIRRSAFYDSLTNLPNRALFMDRLVYSLNRRRRAKMQQFSVLFIDLDEFGVINEGLGHRVGDLVIASIGARIKSTLRPEDTLSRFSGDIFGVLLDPVDSVQDVIQICNRIQAAISAPLELEGNVLNVHATTGIVIHNGDYESSEDFVRDADTAMHRAKVSAKGSYIVFDNEMHKSAVRFIEWKNGIQQAINDDAFEVHYQPIISIATEQVVSMEALARWPSKEGYIPPSEFIPVAEQTGLIRQLGEWVLKTVCQQIKCWERLGYDNLRVAVNLSGKQFEHDVDKEIKKIIADAEINPTSLALEITEGVVMKDIDHNIRMLEELRDLGLNISIDDFGTGYSSLAYLKRFPIHTLKIDRSFIMDLERDGDDLAITKAIISLAKNLHLKVLAEGVETDAQLSILRDSGCDYVQGYFFSRPLPASELLPYLKTQNTKVSALRL